jgi:hypothetical protein
MNGCVPIGSEDRTRRASGRKSLRRSKSSVKCSKERRLSSRLVGLKQLAAINNYHGDAVFELYNSHKSADLRMVLGFRVGLPHPIIMPFL